MKRPYLVLVLALVICFILGVFCLTKDPAKAATESLKLGVCGVLSGQWSQWGKNVIEGVEIATDEINAKGGILGRKVELYIRDDEGVGDKALAGTKELAERIKVDAQIGPVTTVSVYAMLGYINSQRVPFLMPSASGTLIDPPKHPYTFKLIYSDRDKYELAAEVVSKRYKNIAFLYTSDQWGVNLKNFFLGGMDKIGAKPTILESMLTTDVDVTGQLQRITAKNPDVLILGMLDPQCAVVIRNMVKLGIKMPVLTQGASLASSVMTITGPDVWKEVRPYFWFYNSRNLTYTEKEPLSSGVKELLDKVAKRYAMRNRAMDNVAASYDAVYLLKHVFEKARSTDPDKFKQTMESISGWRGLLTTYDYSPTKHMSTVEVVLSRFTGKNPDWELQSITERVE